jgi:hypothetical protein
LSQQLTLFNIESIFSSEIVKFDFLELRFYYEM